MRLRRLNDGPAQSRQCRTKLPEAKSVFQIQAFCLALVTMTCQLRTRICDSSTTSSAINFAESNQETSNLTAEFLKIRHPEIAVWLVQIPCSRAQIPCSFAKIPCSAK